MKELSVLEVQHVSGGMSDLAVLGVAGATVLGGISFSVAAVSYGFACLTNSVSTKISSANVMAIGGGIFVGVTSFIAIESLIS